MELSKDLKSRQEVRDLVEAAAKAQETLGRMDQNSIDSIVEAMAKAASQQFPLGAEKEESPVPNKMRPEALGEFLRLSRKKICCVKTTVKPKIKEKQK